MIISIPISLVATPVWGALCRRFGKQQAWAVGYVGAGVASLSYYFIGPGENAALLLITALIVVNALIVVEAVAAPAVLADVVDYGRLRFRDDHAGSYFAFYAMVQKINVGIGAALGLLIAGTFGFDATVTTQSASGRFGLLLAFSLLRRRSSALPQCGSGASRSTGDDTPSSSRRSSAEPRARSSPDVAAGTEAASLLEPWPDAAGMVSAFRRSSDSNLTAWSRRSNSPSTSVAKPSPRSRAIRGRRPSRTR